jgi:hypothetical protein
MAASTFLNEPVHQGSDDGCERRGPKHARHEQLTVAVFVLCSHAYDWLHITPIRICVVLFDGQNVFDPKDPPRGAAFVYPS